MLIPLCPVYVICVFYCTIASVVIIYHYHSVSDGLKKLPWLCVSQEASLYVIYFYPWLEPVCQGTTRNREPRYDWWSRCWNTNTSGDASSCYPVKWFPCRRRHQFTSTDRPMAYFLEFSGKNCFKYVAMFHCRIFSITRTVLARCSEVSSDLIHSVLLFVCFMWYFQLSLFPQFNCDWLANKFLFRRPISHSLVANVFPRFPNIIDIVFGC